MEQPQSVNFDTITIASQTTFEGHKETLKQHLDNALEVIVAAARRHKKGAELRLTIVVKPGDGNEMDIFPELSVKVPKPKPLPVTFFANKAGQLFIDDPDQAQLPDTKRFRKMPEEAK